MRDAFNRLQKYSSKMDPDSIKQRFTDHRDNMVNQEEAIFGELVLIESKAKSYLESVGVPTIQIPFYLDFARQCYKYFKKFSQDTRTAEIQYWWTHWASRGLDGTYLAKIAELCGVSVPGYAEVPVIPEILEEIFDCRSSDGSLIRSGEDYDAVRDAVDADAIDDTADLVTVGQGFSEPFCVIARGCLFFDTSSLPDDAVIVSAKLMLTDLTAEEITNYVGFYVIVQEGSGDHPHEPLISSDYDRTKYAGNYAQVWFEGVKVPPISYEFNLSNPSAIINRAGITKFCLRSSRDIDGIPPEVLVGEVVYFASQDYVTETYRPKLVVRYYVP